MICFLFLRARRDIAINFSSKLYFFFYKEKSKEKKSKEIGRENVR